MLEKFFQNALNTPHTVKFVGYTFSCIFLSFLCAFRAEYWIERPCLNGCANDFPHACGVPRDPKSLGFAVLHCVPVITGDAEPEFAPFHPHWHKKWRGIL